MRPLSRHAVQASRPLTAFAAGAVDIISFATLGGILASAMTGNIALLAFHLARGDSLSALRCVVALSGFVLGCACAALQSRSRPQFRSVRRLLVAESTLLLCFALGFLFLPHAAHDLEHGLILTLSFAMGLQAIIGQISGQTTIVFTTTLTQLVTIVTASLANRRAPAWQDIYVPTTVTAAYVCGALAAAALIARGMNAGVFLPAAAVGVALAMHAGKRSDRRGDQQALG